MLDLAAVVPSMAGPKRPEGRVALPVVAEGFATALAGEYKKPGEATKRYPSTITISISATAMW